LKDKLIIILTVLTISCTNQTRQPIEIRHFARVNELKRTIRANLVTKVSTDSIQYLYGSDSTVVFVFKISKNDKRELTYFDFNAPLVDKKVLIANGQETEVLKYDYDEPNMFDEEESIFFIDSYGVIAIKGNSWPYVLQFDKGGQLEKEIFKLLQRDTSGFYGHRPPPRINIE
jgi:hypothetical protein